MKQVLGFILLKNYIFASQNKIFLNQPNLTFGDKLSGGGKYVMKSKF